MKLSRFTGFMANGKEIKVTATSFHSAVLLITSEAMKNGWNSEILRIKDGSGNLITDVKIMVQYISTN